MYKSLYEAVDNIKVSEAKTKTAKHAHRTKRKLRENDDPNYVFIDREGTKVFDANTYNNTLHLGDTLIWYICSSNYPIYEIETKVMDLIDCIVSLVNED